MGYNPYTFPLGNQPLSYGLSTLGSPNMVPAVSFPESPTFGYTAPDFPAAAPALAMPNIPSAGGIDPSVADRLLKQQAIWDGRNGLGKTMWNQDGSFNWGAVGSIADAIGGLGQLYMGLQANKLAKQSLALSRESYEKNMANTIASYNMALEDRAYARAAQNGTSRSAADDYITKHKL